MGERRREVSFPNQAQAPSPPSLGRIREAAMAAASTDSTAAGRERG